MRHEVIIIGGGLSGLAAAYELEQRGVPYTLIEVKPRLGGSIDSVSVNGFTLDGGTFAFERPPHWPTLDDLHLADALFRLADVPYARQRVAFQGGTATLIHALAAKLNGTLLHRMAVTGIGVAANGGYTVCLENGLALGARAVIVATPARYAERVFRSAVPEVSRRLAGYYYDTVTHIGLGYLGADAPAAPTAPPHMLFAALTSTTHPSRIPAGGLLIQAAVRIASNTPDVVLNAVLRTQRWRTPDAVVVRHWAESHPLTVGGFPGRLAGLHDLLPARVGLVGSCYTPGGLPALTEAARATARQIVAQL